MIKLYHKKLNSLEELRQEKAKVKHEANTAFTNILDGKNSTDGSAESTVPDMIQAGLDVLTSKGITDKLFALVLPALRLAGRKIEKDILKSLAKEFVVGYAKWKAIELGTKAILSFFDKEHKDD
ncbi:MAG: hypothetical protein H6550_15735 [Chitinophagales bacterium]|nr:hypothetical protein [Chitinophagales bacterium]